MPDSFLSPRSYGQYCAIARALDHIGDRWTLLVVRELVPGPKRFADLLDGLPGIATNLLTDRLRRLEADGIVEHTAADYSLTPLGHALQPVLDSLITWGGYFMSAGRDDQAFRPQWMSVALGVIGQGRRPAAVVRACTEDGAMVLRGTIKGLVAPDEWTGPVDAEVRCSSEDLLGVLTGLTTLDRLVVDGVAEVVGEVEVVDELLRPRRRLLA